MQIQLIPSHDVTRLTTLLKDADEDTARIAHSIENSTNTAYVVYDDAACIGALMMHWQPEESEIVYIAVDEAYRGRGYGKAAIAAVIVEAQERGVRSVIVGTANSSLDNIAFYQKSGFQMDSIRKDYFSYLPTPVYEQGILIRDMLVLRMEL